MNYILQLVFVILLSYLPCLHQQEKHLQPSLEVYESPDKCNYTLISPKRVINPYKALIMNFVPQKPFSSFYLKCAACLAVANQISRIIENMLEQSKTSQICRDSINQNISNKVNGLCVRGFKNYDLRRCKNFTVVTDKFKCTEHVKSTMDGEWTKKLRELCSLYTAHMDLEHISNIYSNNTQELSTHLCKGTGIFRDCQNLKFHLPTDLEEKCYCPEK